MDCYIGQIELFPYTFAPLYWALCNGQILPISQYQPLYALIGAQYGGDGITTFALPNLLGTEPIPNTAYYISLTDGCFPTRS